MLEVPWLAFQETVVLRKDPTWNVERNIHVLCSCSPSSNLRPIQSGFQLEGIEHLRLLELKALDGFGRKSQIVPRHQVRISVIVDDCLVFIGAGHTIDAKLASFPGGKKTQITPKASGLHKHLGAAVEEEFFVPGGVEIFSQAICNVRIYVVLSSSGFVICRSFFSTNGTPR